MYRVFIETHFAASHQLRGYQGLCKDLHGHTWKVRVEIETDQTNEIGISFDFKELKSITESVTQRLDHHHINEIKPFDQENPTAENLARYIFTEIREKLPSFIRLSKVMIWESANYAVTYSEGLGAQS